MEEDFISLADFDGQIFMLCRT
uniref:Uncharacterized protein n=1 Tax=Arundo donax TaxID=35708 RepID=A0A0A9GNG2_ARUDO